MTVCEVFTVSVFNVLCKTFCSCSFGIPLRSNTQNCCSRLKAKGLFDPLLPYVSSSFALDGLAKKFGLTPEQFGENLRDSYQRHETEQFPAEPLELAKDYVCR